MSKGLSYRYVIPVYPNPIFFSLLDLLWRMSLLMLPLSTSRASQEQIETAERAGGREFEELGAENLTQKKYHQSGQDCWLYNLKRKNEEVRAT